MLSWFSTLSPGERCAAMAIVDDSTFIQIYLHLLRKELNSRKENNCHALFAKDMLIDYYEARKSKSYRDKTSKKTFDSKYYDTLSALPSSELRNSFVKSSTSSSDLENSELSDPFNPASRNGKQHPRLPGFTSFIHDYSQRSIEIISNIAIQNIVKKMTKSDSLEVFTLSDNIHKNIVVSSCNGSELDCMFLQYAIDDFTKLIQSFKTLTSNRIFSFYLNPSDVKEGMNSKMFYESKWITYPTSCYNLLLGRVELSMWSAFYACGGYLEYPGTSLSFSENKNISKLLKKENKELNSSSLKILTKSSLAKLHSSATMLSIGCTIEELKLFWRRLNPATKLQILNCHPLAQACLAELERCHIHSDTIIDRLVLCPLEWAVIDSGKLNRSVIEYMKALRTNLGIELLLQDLDPDRYSINGLTGGSSLFPLSIANRTSSNPFYPPYNHQENTKSNQNDLSNWVNSNSSEQNLNDTTSSRNNENTLVQSNISKSTLRFRHRTSLQIDSTQSNSLSISQSHPYSPSQINVPSVQKPSEFKNTLESLDENEEISSFQTDSEDKREYFQFNFNHLDNPASFTNPVNTNASNKKKKRKKKKKVTSDNGNMNGVSNDDQTKIHEDGGCDEDEEGHIESFGTSNINEYHATIADEYIGPNTESYKGKLTSISETEQEQEQEQEQDSDVNNDAYSFNNKEEVKVSSENDHSRDESEVTGLSATINDSKSSSDFIKMPIMEISSVNVKEENEITADSSPSRHSLFINVNEPTVVGGSCLKSDELTNPSPKNRIEGVKLADEMMEEERRRRIQEQEEAIKESNEIRNENIKIVDTLMEDERKQRMQIIELHLQKSLEERRQSSARAIQAMEIERKRRIELDAALREKAHQEELLSRQESYQFASAAIEQERLRRMKEIESYQLLDDIERKARQAWAANQVLQEQQARLQISEATMLQLQKRLTKNIRAFHKVMLHRMDVHKMTQIAVLNEIQLISANIWPQATVRIYGSSSTGLALPSSDIDIVIQLVPHKFEQSDDVYSLGLQHQMQQDLGHNQMFSFYPQNNQSLMNNVPMPLPEYSQNRLYSSVDPSQNSEFRSSSYNHPSGRGFQGMGGRIRDGSDGGTTTNDMTSTMMDDDGASSQNASQLIYADDYSDRRGHSIQGSTTTSRNGSRPPSGRLAEGHRMDEFSGFFQKGDLSYAESTSSTTSQDMSLDTSSFTRQGSMNMLLSRSQSRDANLSQGEVIKNLYVLAGELFKRKWALDVNPIPTASIPLVKLNVKADVLLSSPSVIQAFTGQQQQNQVVKNQLNMMNQPTMPIYESPTRNDYNWNNQPIMIPPQHMNNFPRPFPLHIPPMDPVTMQMMMQQQAMQQQQQYMYQQSPQPALGMIPSYQQPYPVHGKQHRSNTFTGQNTTYYEDNSDRRSSNISDSPQYYSNPAPVVISNITGNDSNLNQNNIPSDGSKQEKASKSRGSTSPSSSIVSSPPMSPKGQKKKQHGGKHVSNTAHVNITSSPEVENQLSSRISDDIHGVSSKFVDTALSGQPSKHGLDNDSIKSSPPSAQNLSTDVKPKGNLRKSKNMTPSPEIKAALEGPDQLPLEHVENHASTFSGLSPARPPQFNPPHMPSFNNLQVSGLPKKSPTNNLNENNHFFTPNMQSPEHIHMRNNYNREFVSQHHSSYRPPPPYVPGEQEMYGQSYPPPPIPPQFYHPNQSLPINSQAAHMNSSMRHQQHQESSSNYSNSSNIYQPRAPQNSYLPFHQAIPQAKGITIPIDITIESGEHKGISTCDYIRSILSQRPHPLPLVVKVIKNLLVNAGLNVPFNGGLSSYSVFLMVCAAYESCLFSDATQESESLRAASSSGKNLDNESEMNTNTSSKDESELKTNNNLEEVSKPSRDIEGPSLSSKSNVSRESKPGDDDTASRGGDENQSSRSYTSKSTNNGNHTITEGKLFLHFLKLFGRDFDPQKKGIDVLGRSPILFDLTPEQQAIVGTSCWIKDPLDPSKNVARPSYAFKQIQHLFSHYLGALEREHIQLVRNQYGKSTTSHSSTSSGSYDNRYNSPYHHTSNPHLHNTYHGNHREQGNHYNNRSNNHHNHRNNWNSNSQNNRNQGGQHSHGHSHNSYNQNGYINNGIANSNRGPKNQNYNNSNTRNNLLNNPRNLTNNEEPDLLKVMMRY